MKKKKSNGMILITTMLFITIIVMIATLIAVQGKSALQNGNLSLQSEEAYLAALSGIEYVRGELRKNQNFGTSDFSTKTSELVNGLLVKYSGKNLTGYLGYNSDNDYKSKFSISFNDPNATTNTTGGNYKHTSSDCKYPSLNNLNTSGEVKGYRRDVPAYSIYIVSKGVCGKAVRYAEAFLTSDSSPSIDGGTTIGGNITIKGTAKDYSKGTSSNDTKRNSLLTVEHVNTSLPGKLTAFSSGTGETDKDIKLSAGNTNDIYDLLNLGNSVSLNGHLTNSFSEPSLSDEYLHNLWSKLTVNRGAKVNVKDLNSLTFDKVRKNIENSDNEAQNNIKPSYTLAPGTYAYIRETDESKGVNGYWKFVNTTNPDTAITNLNNKTSVSNITNVGGIFFGGKPLMASKTNKSTAETRTITLTGNVYSKGDINFIIVDKVDSKTTGKNGETQITSTYKLADSSVDFQVNGGSLISDGSIYINGEVVGYGNLISNGNITFNAGSELEVDENQKVAVWANGDVNIKRATNVSNNSLVEIFNETYNKDNKSGDVQDITDIQSNRLLTGIIGDNVREKTGDPNKKVLQDIKEQDIGGSKEVSFNYKASEDNWRGYTFVLTGNYIELVSVNVLNPNDIKRDYIVDSLKASGQEGQYTIRKEVKADEFDGIAHVVARQYGNNLIDINVFIKEDDKYYYVTTIDFSRTENKAFVAEDENEIGFLTGSNILNEKNNGNVCTTPQALSSAVASSDDAKTYDEKEANTEIALTTSIANANTKLKGTVYSREGDIKIDIGTTDFDIIGALVTSAGDLDIKAGHVHLKYDPNYVPFFKDASGVKTNVRFLSSFIGGFDN